MYYAICPKQDGKIWTILKGWIGCQAGQGNIVADNLTYEQMVKQLNDLKEV
jgi:hypothetical protein